MPFLSLLTIALAVEHAQVVSVSPGESARPEMSEFPVACKLHKEPDSMSFDGFEPPRSPSPFRSRMPSATSSSISLTPQTPTRPSRTYTSSSFVSTPASASTASIFSRASSSSRTTYSSAASAVSYPLSLNSFASATSATSYSVPLLPPYAPSPLVQPSPDDAKAVLTLDGGGVRGIFAPLFLQSLQKHLPSDVDARTLLDLVGGTSTGGVAALMFARLGLPIEKVVSTYLEMPKKLFGCRKMKGIWWLLTSSQHSTKKQQKLYSRTVREIMGYADAPLKAGDDCDGRPQCPVFVVAVDTTDLSKPTVFSSYSTSLSSSDTPESLDEEPPTDDEKDPSDTSEEVSIVTAALATSAAPTYFHPTPHAGRTYIDGGIGFNNPSEIALKQLTHLYGPNAHVHTFVSLGTGRRPTNPFATPRGSGVFGFRFGITGMFDILRAFAHISTDSEAVHTRMSEQFSQTGAYFRFNPPGLEDVVLDDWTAVDRAVEASMAYLDLPETQKRIAEVASRLLRARGLVNRDE